MDADLVLPVVIWICVGLAALWLVLALFARWQRRTYNLTRAESGGAGAKPDFLKVDHAKRDEALSRASPSEAAQTEAVAKRSRWARLAGNAATVFALLTLIVGVFEALSRLDDYTAMASETAALLTDTNAMMAVVRDYWAGLLIALAVILVKAGRVWDAWRKS